MFQVPSTFFQAISIRGLCKCLALNLKFKLTTLCFKRSNWQVISYSRIMVSCLNFCQQVPRHHMASLGHNELTFWLNWLKISPHWHHTVTAHGPNLLHRQVDIFHVRISTMFKLHHNLRMMLIHSCIIEYSLRKFTRSVYILNSSFATIYFALPENMRLSHN